MTGWQEHFNFENQMVCRLIRKRIERFRLTSISLLTRQIGQVSDATPGFLLLILMSLVPVDLRQFKDDRKTNHRFRQKKFEYLLNWNNVIRKLPWNVILLFGGGLALAEATQVRPELVQSFHFLSGFRQTGKLNQTFSLRPEIRTIRPADPVPGQNEHQVAAAVHFGSYNLLRLFHRDRQQLGGDRHSAARGQPRGAFHNGKVRIFLKFCAAD